MSPCWSKAWFPVIFWTHLSQTANMIFCTVWEISFSTVSRSVMCLVVMQIVFPQGWRYEWWRDDDTAGQGPPTQGVRCPGISPNSSTCLVLALVYSPLSQPRTMSNSSTCIVLALVHSHALCLITPPTWSYASHIFIGPRCPWSDLWVQASVTEWVSYLCAD